MCSKDKPHDRQALKPQLLPTGEWRRETAMPYKLAWRSDTWWIRSHMGGRAALEKEQGSLKCCEKTKNAKKAWLEEMEKDER